MNIHILFVIYFWVLTVFEILFFTILFLKRKDLKEAKLNFDFDLKSVITLTLYIYSIYELFN